MASAAPPGAASRRAAALVAVALHLPGELVRDEVDRVLEVGRCLARPQRDALEVERRLGDLAVGDRGVLLDQQLDLELGQLGDLLGDLAEALLDMGSEARP